MKLAPVLLVLLAHAIPSAAQSVNNPCKLPPDLFGRRAALEKEFESAEPGSTTLDERRARRRALDEQYYQFMIALADDAKQQRLAELKTCCGRNMRDPIARLICGLAFYHTKQSTAKEFVEQFPVSGNLDPLWALDDIAGVSGEERSMPPLFGPDGPVNSYTTELMKLVTKGNKQALQKYLQLGLRAEGYFAEDMWDQVKTLVSEHPEVVLENWDALRNNDLVTEVLAHEFSENEKRQVQQRYEHYCHINERACRDVIRALK